MVQYVQKINKQVNQKKQAKKRQILFPCYFDNFHYFLLHASCGFVTIQTKKSCWGKASQTSLICLENKGLWLLHLTVVFVGRQVCLHKLISEHTVFKNGVAAVVPRSFQRHKVSELYAVYSRAALMYIYCIIAPVIVDVDC